MMPRDAETDLLVNLEAAVGGQHDDRRWLHRVFRRQHDTTVVDLRSDGGGVQGGRERARTKRKQMNNQWKERRKERDKKSREKRKKD